MSHVNSKDINAYEKKYVVTYKELILTSIVFCVILFVLYPKDLLKNQILSEASNYDLSMLYLRNMLDNDPSNESLMMGLAEQSLRSGKRDLSFRLLELLHNSKDYDMRKKANVLSYKLAKEDYFFFKDKKKKQEQMLKIAALFENIMLNKFYNEDDIDIWHKEALFVKDDFWTNYFLKKRIKKNPSDVKLLEEGYYLAMKLGNKRNAISLLHALQQHDKYRKNQWIFAEYHMAMDAKKYIEAEMILKKHSDDSLSFKDELAHFYNSRGAYIKSSQIYMSLYHDIHLYSVKKRYLIKAIKELQAGNYLSQAVDLAAAYEKRYINDREVRSYILKLYIAAGDLNKATQLAKKLLKMRR